MTKSKPAVAAVKAAEKSEATELRLEQALNAIEAINALNGYDRVIGNGDAARGVRVLYKFGSTVHLIAKIRGVVRRSLEPYNDERADLVKTLTDGASEISSETHPAEFKQFAEWNGKQMKSKLQLADLPQLTIAELKLDQNEIPNWVIDALIDSKILVE